VSAELLPTILGIVLVAIAAGFALLPLARGTRPAAESSNALEDTDRAPIYRQVLELEFDYQLGKLSSEDYHQLSAELLARASELMRAEQGELSELDDEIEREIAAARAAFSAARESGRARRAAGSPR
jgi:cytochrome c-type biogenesis protein CcmI